MGEIVGRTWPGCKSSLSCLRCKFPPHGWWPRLIVRTVKVGLLKLLNDEMKLLLVNKTESLGVEIACVFVSYSEGNNFFRKNLSEGFR